VGQIEVLSQREDNVVFIYEAVMREKELKWSVQFLTGALLPERNVSCIEMNRPSVQTSYTKGNENENVIILFAPYHTN
jgi:hypothetical protein